MKRWYTISAFLISFAAIAFWVFSNNSGASDNEGITENEELEKAGIKGYYEWLFENRKNPTTGELTVNDILEGRRQVEEYRATHSTRGGGLALNWEFVGPNNIGGRTRAIVIDPNNTNRMYAAGISGGVFYTDNAGQQWYSCAGNESLGSLLVGAMTLAENGDLYIGTGESNTGYFDGTASFTHAFVGNGIYKSSDGGQTFTLLSATEPTPGVIGSSSSVSWAYVYRVDSKPGDANTLVAGQNKGLWYSTDGGSTWTACSSALTGGLMNSSEATEAMFDADGYLHAIYSNRYYRSVNNADPFTLDLYGENLPASGLSRVTIALAPSDPNYVYAYAAKSDESLKGIYRSTDRGITFEAISPEGSALFDPPEGQGSYNLAIVVNPSNKDRVYIGGASQSYTWQDGGAWSSMSNGYFFPEYSAKYIHPDHHTFVFSPTDPNIMYVGSDGGISRTTNALSAYPDFATMNKGYSTYQAHGVASGFYGEAIGGSQDNGTYFVNFLGNSTLEGLRPFGGDGGRAHVSRIRPEYLFGTSVGFLASGPNGGGLRRSVNGGQSQSSFFDCNIDYTGGGGTGCSQDGFPDGGGEFVTEWKIWENWDLYSTFEGILEEGGTVEYPAGSGNFYANGDMVNYEGRDILLNKSNISESRLYFASGPNVWVTNGALFSSTEASEWFKIQTGTTIGIPTAFDFTNDGDILYVGTSSGKLYRFEGLLEANYEYIGDVFDPVAAGITQYVYPEAFGSRITGISINRNNPDEVALSVGGYGVDQNVYYSTDALDNDAADFTGIAGQLPNIPVFDVLIESYNPDVILAATEYGVWSYNVASGGEWTQETSIIGNVPVLEIREDWIRDQSCSAIYIGTHGRGFYRATNLASGECDFTLQNDVAADMAPIQEEIIAGVSLSPNPADDLTQATFTISKTATVSIKIYSITGELAGSYGSTTYNAGTNTVSLNIKSLMPGVYLVVFESAGSYPKSAKLSVY